MPLQLKYRPGSFKNVIGNAATVDSLKSVLERKGEDLPHAFLFIGPSGTGKTTLARIVAKMVGCSKSDFCELDSADFRGIDTVREIRRRMHYAPQAGPCRVWLMDECHQMTKDAQEALLKALEDTPAHVYFILATTEPEKLKETLKRRCSTFTLSTVLEKELVAHMTMILGREKKTAPPEVLAQIWQDAGGSPGIALAILDKIVDLAPAQMLEAAKQQATLHNETIELCRVLMKGASWKEIATIIKGIEAEPESFRRMMLGYATNTLLNGNPKAAIILDCFRENYYDNGKAGLVLSCWEAMGAKG